MPRMCCVPLCSSNYRSQGGPTITTFSFPKNEDRRQLWLKCIPRENFVPGNSAAVCIKHFKEEFILREVSATRDDGTILVVPRDRPKLSEVAYPTIFEDVTKIPIRCKKFPNRRGRVTTRNNEEDVDEPSLPNAEKTEPVQGQLRCHVGVADDAGQKEPLGNIVAEMSSQPGPAKQLRKRETSDGRQSRGVMEPEVTIQEGEITRGSVTCSRCNASLASRELLQAHSAACQPLARPTRAHPRAAPAPPAKEILTSDGVQMYKTVIHTGQTLYSCEECPALFTSYFHLEEHKKVHPGSRPLFVEATSDAEGAGAMAAAAAVAPTFAAFGRKAKKVKEEKTYVCPVCQEKFQAFAELRVHKRAHAGSKLHCCDACGKCFQRASKLKVHKRVHTNERPYACEVCHARFTQLGNLNIHKRTHSGERPFRCDVCQAAFMQPTHLKVHKRCHTGERPYGCTLCGAAFSQMTSLVLHKRTHTGERPYPCDLCGLAFNSRGDLKVHQRRHTGERPYTCNLCHASFTHQGTLNVHKRRHAGKRPFLCDACGVAFITLSELKTHKRRHTGEQPYRCDACGAGFTQVGSLNTHKRRHQEQPEGS